ncbi:MAG: hypothetical protein HDR88_16645 [Bacteroides sp.]|nr:hypothetical protein [Bacteroides sp.]
MKKIFFKHFVMIFMVGLMSAMGANAGVNQPPTGATTEYLSACYYAPTNENWYYDGYSYVQKIAFENSMLYIHKLCGDGWSIGEVSEDANEATFKTPQQVSNDQRIQAYYLDVNNEEIMLDEFIFTFNEDKSELNLKDYEGNNVILRLETNNGNGTMWWTQVSFQRFNETAAVPPVDGNISYYNMKYSTGWSEDEKLLQMVTKDDSVWFQDLMLGWLTGTKDAEGNIRFHAPQYVGSNGGYLQYTYAIRDGELQNLFELTAIADGQYSLNSELWAGETGPEYCLAKSAELYYVDVYLGQPKNPTDILWDNDIANCVDFTMHPEGLNGEEIPAEWLCWQVLVNGEPYIYTTDNFPNLGWYIDGDSSILPGSIRFYETSVTGQSFDWGSLGNNKYRCYIPGTSYNDKIEIRCGNKVGSGKIYWSDAIAVAELTPNKLPEGGIYSATIQFDTPQGPYSEGGFAMYVNYNEDAMSISGMFQHYVPVEGSFVDSMRREAIFMSGQSLGLSETGEEITLIAAIATTPEPYDPDAPVSFDKVEDFRLTIAEDGLNIRNDSKDVYLLEVYNDDIIMNVICPGMRLNLVRDEINVYPEDATVSSVSMAYDNIRSEQTETTITFAEKGDEIWLEFEVNSSWFKDDYVPVTIAVKGERTQDELIFDLPQFIGVSFNKVSYLTTDSYSFAPNQLIFKKLMDGIYQSNNELWVGVGGMEIASWLAGSNFVINTNTTSVNGIADHKAVGFENGKFISSDNSDIEIYSISGMKMRNSNLTAGTYIVVVNGKAKKMSVR